MIRSVLLLFVLLNSARIEPANICLTMIVKNEEAIIERCLESALPIVDYMMICDTGSSDRTVQIIEEYFERNNIPGRVCRHEWKNFGHNRTLSFQAAQKALKEEGFALDDTFLLFLDADMVLKAESDFNKNSLNHHAYAIEQKNQYNSSYNVRMVSAALPWRCVGETYEYWSCGSSCDEMRLHSLKIDDRNDGGCRSEKYERDIKLLRQALEGDAENARNMFYLALSYKGIQSHEEAIKWFQARMQKGGEKEEVWYSKLMTGECCEAMGNWGEALKYYLDAYQSLPDRAEPLQHISTYYRYQSQNDLAYLFASQAKQIPYPRHHSLFISHPAYDYMIDEDIAVSAYYTSFQAEGFAAANRLMLKRDIPDNIGDQAHKNMLFYVQNLEGAHFQPLEFDLPPIRKGLAAKYNPMNSSILKTGDGYEVICRTVNYIQIGAKHFKSLDLMDNSNLIRSRNFLLRYDRAFNLLSQQEVIEDLPFTRYKVRNIEGLEDCRMFKFKNSTWFTCTTLDTNPTGYPQISLCKLSDDRTDPTVRVEKLISMFGPDPRRCEKNWLPFVVEGQLHLIYSCDPYIIFKPEIDFENDRLYYRTNLHFVNLAHNFSRFSGSAAPIEFDEGYLAMVHEAIYDDTQRNYTHRFVYLDKNLNFKRLSKPFTFLHKGIEYCCGMTKDHSNQNLVMTIGIEDREAYLGFVSLNTVRALLEPLP